MLEAVLYPNRQAKKPKRNNGLYNTKSLFPETTEYRKSRFLQSLTPFGGKNKYKRYIASPLRYAGGKTLAVGLIVELIPANIKRLISPFLGGGSVEIAVAKELNIPVVGFDIFDILINYWDMQLNNPKHYSDDYQSLNLLEKDLRKPRTF